MRRDGLRRLGRVSYVPRGQGAVRVAADEVLALVVDIVKFRPHRPATRMPSLSGLLSFQQANF